LGLQDSPRGVGVSSPGAVELALGEESLPRVSAQGDLFIFLVFLPHLFCETFPSYLKLFAQIWVNFDFFNIFH
jgi:hypothetical protein